MIEARALVKQYRQVCALDGVGFTIDSPGVVGLLGPNGAGKTTLMRILAGGLGMTSGTAIVAGHDVVTEASEARARVGYLPETPALHADLQVGEMLDFVAELRGVPNRPRQVSAVMERVGLSDCRTLLCGRLSSGFRQRLGLAIALVHDPQVLILDEPTTFLDPVQLQPLRSLLAELGKERLVLFSTHVLSEVRAVCSRVLVLHEGRVRADLPVAEIGNPVWFVRAAGTAVAERLAALDSVSTVHRVEEGRYALRGSASVPEEVGALAKAQGWTLTELSREDDGMQAAFLAWCS